MLKAIIPFLILLCMSPAMAYSDLKIVPYAGQEHRNIKALSTSDIAGYLNGKGLGYAKAAELNHYPGPSHVLAMSEELALTEEQIIKSQVIFNEMEKAAKSIGIKLVDEEMQLDRLFLNKKIETNSLSARVKSIALLSSKLRNIHLGAHLKQAAILKQGQIERYDFLRGYGKELKHEHVSH